VNLDLHDTVKAVFDRIFDGYDVVLACVQLLRPSIPLPDDTPRA